MNGNEISPHEVAVYDAVRGSGDWITAKEVAGRARVAPRTARQHCTLLTKLGVFDVARLFGGYRYRLSAEVGDAASQYLAQLEAAKRVLARKN